MTAENISGNLLLLYTEFHTCFQTTSNQEENINQSQEETIQAHWISQV